MPDRDGWTLLPAAKADLARIWTNGAAEWGMDQADRYADGLFSLFDLLAEFPDMARERNEFRPPVRLHPCGAHLVIYHQAGQGIEIIRLLHAHQNLMAYLLEG
jgi:toxin ParE1/3/4